MYQTSSGYFYKCKGTSIENLKLTFMVADLGPTQESLQNFKEVCHMKSHKILQDNKVK